VSGWADQFPSILRSQVQQILGCAWGRTIFSADDPSLCTEKAVRIVVLYFGGEQAPVKLCDRHLAVILDPEVSTPHDFGPQSEAL
jgi:hypothetical protein